MQLGNDTVRGASWADPFFGELSHDFGPVPRGAKVRHVFRFTNRLDEPVTILDVRASCGCTAGRATASVVPPGGSAAIDAEMDTRNFVGKKATVLRVSLVTAGGREAEVRLGVSSTILSDVVLNPGTIDFGTVTRGKPASQTLTIERVGSRNWQALRMVSACRAIDAKLTETARDSRLVAYRLTVTLDPSTAPGPVRDEIRIITNDAEAPVIPVQVTAAVRGTVSASPSLIPLGKVSSAEGVRGKFLVRASKPFVLRAIEGDGDGFDATVDDSTPKPVHLVTIAYHPEASKLRGDLRRSFRLHTDLIGEPPVEVTATLHVDP
jgi:hypothetical protein